MGLIVRTLEYLDTRRFQYLLFAIALLMRLACLAWWQAGDCNTTVGFDSYYYYAQSWLGWSPPTVDVVQAPGFTLWIAILLGLIGRPSMIAVQLTNIALSIASCFIAADWAEKVLNKRIGRLGAVWIAIDPLLVYFAVQMQSETLAVFMVLLFFWALSRIGFSPRSPWPILGLGLFAGLLSLTRSAMAFYPIFLVATILYLRRKDARRWMWILIFAGWAAPICLWTARNYTRYHAIIPLTTNGGWNLWEGFTLDPEEVSRRPYEMEAELKRQGISEKGNVTIASQYYMAKWKQAVRNDPVWAIKTILGKGLRYWRPWPYAPYPPAIRVGLGLYFTILFGFILYGLRGIKAHFEALAPTFALILYLTLLHSVFFTSLRYRAPLEPFLCVLAAAGLSAVFKSRKRSGI